jgi:tetratricopeptide (TPR) repeat protein
VFIRGKKRNPAMKFILLLLVFTFSSCEKLQEMGQENFKKNVTPKTPSEVELEKWKQKLALEEAEIKELDEKIRKMVRKTKEAGVLSWKIAQGYMRVGNYELSSRYYTQAIQQNMDNKVDVVGSEVHFFEGAIPFFEKALLYRELTDDLLFEAGLAYANASRDRGWDKERHDIAVTIFKGLIRKDPADLRYPYELALIYFDSSVTDGLIDGVDPAGYNDAEKAMKIMNAIIQKEPNNIPARFARANFLYRGGSPEQATEEYLTIKSKLEAMKKAGAIKENLEKNTSYINVVRNLKKLGALK